MKTPWLTLLIPLSGCLAVADGRALLDLEVGHGASQEVTVAVIDGHATVRTITTNNVHLWANAPTLAIDLAVTAPGPVTLRIENVLADATLHGEPSILAMPRDVPTDATWTIDFPTASQYRLTLETSDQSDPSPWRFAVFADVQSAIDEVQDVFSLIDTQGARFALIAGDLTEQGGPEELERFQSEMKSLGIPCFATLGNHELGAGDGNFHDYFGRGTSSFVFRAVRFTFVDSASAMVAPLADEMLDDWLDRPEDLLHVATMHIPPIDPVGIRNGSFASRAEADRLLGRLADGGVDVTFYGHIHSFYAFDNAGIPAFITGGGGAIPERLDGVGRHFVTVDAEPIERRYRTALVRVD